MKKSCKNCKYAKFQLTDKGNIKHSISGECTFEVKMPEKIPMSVTRKYSYDENIFKNRSGIFSYLLEDCDCFEGLK